MLKKVEIVLISVIFFSSFFFVLQISAQTFELVKIDNLNINVGYSIDIEENYAFVADNDGFSIIDITNPM
ncbi:MAG: hypothetical protein ACFFDS_08115, partial [Candidatus Thorarchaeota archaeon]